MEAEEGREKGFCKNISHHIVSRDPEGWKIAIVDMFADEVVADIYVFSSRGYGVGVCYSLSALIVA